MSQASYALAQETVEMPRRPRAAFRRRPDHLQPVPCEVNRPEGSAHDRMVARALALFPGSIVLEG